MKERSDKLIDKCYLDEVVSQFTSAPIYQD